MDRSAGNGAGSRGCHLDIWRGWAGMNGHILLEFENPHKYHRYPIGILQDFSVILFCFFNPPIAFQNVTGGTAQLFKHFQWIRIMGKRLKDPSNINNVHNCF